jgi:hypothetical protein
MGDRFTFAVVGHNEANSLHVAIGQALEAAAPGDRVWFVNSASTDDSAARAAALGAEVVDAPLGKGAAMAVAIKRCRDGRLCFLDADIESSECNIPATLRRAVVDSGADMVVGSFTHPARVLLITPALYTPLTRALFPEIREAEVAVPLSGLRVVRSDLDLGALPPGFGVEAHLNLQVNLTGGVIENCPLGAFEDPLRDYMNLACAAADVAAAILDLAVAHGRLSVAARVSWQVWADNVVAPLWRAFERGIFATHDFEQALAAGANPLPLSATM